MIKLLNNVITYVHSTGVHVHVHVCAHVCLGMGVDVGARSLATITCTSVNCHIISRASIQALHNSLCRKTAYFQQVNLHCQLN